MKKFTRKNKTFFFNFFRWPRRLVTLSSKIILSLLSICIIVSNKQNEINLFTIPDFLNKLLQPLNGLQINQKIYAYIIQFKKPTGQLLVDVQMLIKSVHIILFITVHISCIAWSYKKQSNHV